ncbi:hypothetical protein AUR04nite_34490 [Glutamicibacter uratoxydans]|uniref:Uncharacterized protein n=1 Tax=Glutamicibacter uratoxydans TaxID=43667 RepID=A0A4Y4DTG3_GLUUR|nr:hypothetical protein AUR04nite_34490 [Glutamicibacter uratoxydans]
MLLIPESFPRDEDPYSQSYIELFFGHPTVAPALNFSTDHGFSYAKPECQDQLAEETWLIDSFGFGIKYDNDPIISSIPATFDQVQDFLLEHKHEIKPDNLLQETAFSWSETRASIKMQQLIERCSGEKLS